MKALEVKLRELEEKLSSSIRAQAAGQAGSSDHAPTGGGGQGVAVEAAPQHRQLEALKPTALQKDPHVGESSLCCLFETLWLLSEPLVTALH